MQEKVSVIIPTYKGSKYLSRAIDSVLNQTYENIEVIVVDDNNPESYDRKLTEDIMKNYEIHGNITYLKHKNNKNGSVARNTGIGQATGDFVCFLDDDDIYLPKRIELSVKKLVEENSDSILCDVAVVKDKEFIVYIKQNYYNDMFYQLLVNENLLGTGSNLFFRKKTLDRIGLFDETLKRNQDYDYFLRFLVCSNKVSIINKCLIVKEHIPKVTKVKYQDLVDTKNYLLNKYKNEISNLSKEKQNNVFIYQHKVLLEIAFDSKDVKAQKKEIETLKKLGYGETTRFVDVLFSAYSRSVLAKKIVSKIRKNVMHKKYGELNKMIVNYFN